MGPIVVNTNIKNCTSCIYHNLKNLSGWIIDYVHYLAKAIKCF